ncbi:maleylacetoacetate isomerase [Thalassococcus sp. CAU 1522]|uniref:Maleylacetoacetate isomerase n=1 Tax=Thalassococcus arenae TaxID=2851652 RepID=A0ABS6N6T7_9RHOB|nr:maleylacetoacetate isomerase [Thalassococcus arenae]MBV2359736.1 maleylacetoacetate isomerase [Thalassococcus arenae]
MILYSYWRSTTSLRVRAAMNLKGLDYAIRPVNLLEGGQKAPDYVALNPGAGVPTLVLDDGTVLTQSMAILEWLDEVYPDPPLLPRHPLERARVRAAADVFAADVHPVNNLRVVMHLKSLGHGPDACRDWMHHWMIAGFAAFQAMIRPDTRFCFGDSVTQADLCLVAQMVNAVRWGVDMAPFARLTAIDAAARALPPIAAALLETQPDAVGQD